MSDFLDEAGPQIVAARGGLAPEYKGRELEPYIDSAYGEVWVTEAQYTGTGGSLIRQQWEPDQIEGAYAFLVNRASTDWVKMWRVAITREWTLERSSEEDRVVDPLDEALAWVDSGPTVVGAKHIAVLAEAARKWNEVR